MLQPLTAGDIGDATPSGAAPLAAPLAPLAAPLAPLAAPLAPLAAPLAPLAAPLAPLAPLAALGVESQLRQDEKF